MKVVLGVPFDYDDFADIRTQKRKGRGNEKAMEAKSGKEAEAKRILGFVRKSLI